LYLFGQRVIGYYGNTAGLVSENEIFDKDQAEYFRHLTGYDYRFVRVFAWIFKNLAYGSRPELPARSGQKGDEHQNE
jgi:hypothetical protein